MRPSSANATSDLQRRAILALLGGGCALAAFAARAAAQDFALTIGANPGGGYDQVGRGIGRALVDCGAAAAVRYENRGGAGGTLALARFATAARGQPHALLVVGAVMAGAIVQTRPPVTLADATPIASLIAEHNVVVVPAASPLRDMAELMRRLRRDPGSLKWGGGSKGSVDQIALAMLGRAAGVDIAALNYVPFKGGGEAAAAVLGGFLDVATSGISELEEFIASGRLRALAITAPRRLAGVDIPTLREQGIAVELANWRGVYAAAGLDAPARLALVAAIEQAVRTPSWQAVMARNHWTPQLITGDDFGRFVEAEMQRLRDLMRGLGLV